MRTWIRSLSILTMSSIALTTASAAVFPDVPSGHIFQKSVEQLVDAGVVNGNPDGNFYPDRAVNRAEMLKMLYLAKGKQPDRNSVRCFPDVIPGSWYESYVCDAAANRYVAGYNDGTFRPANEVNRVEALKMIQEVLEFEVDDIDDYDRSVINFVDVSISAWYTKYLFNAFTWSILPIPGQDTSRFYPDQVLKRGEAAAMIYNALNADLRKTRQQIEDELNKDPDDQDPPDEGDDDDDQGDGQDQQDPPADTNKRDVSFPLDESGKFNGKKSFSYHFDITSTITVRTQASLQSGQRGEIRCTLYLIDDDGFSEEYYIGVQEGQSCYLLTTLTPGSYQLQLQPTSDDTTYTVVADGSNGDGNDGFSEALNLNPGVAKTYMLDVNNFQNWYMFRNESENEKRMKVELSNIANLSCIVYAMEDVDLYGFSGPECNQYYMYPPGTYYIAVGRKAPKTSKQTYTIMLRQ